MLTIPFVVADGETLFLSRRFLIDGEALLPSQSDRHLRKGIAVTGNAPAGVPARLAAHFNQRDHLFHRRFHGWSTSRGFGPFFLNFLCASINEETQSGRDPHACREHISRITAIIFSIWIGAFREQPFDHLV